MIFQRALIRELTQTAGAVFLVLFTITLTTMLIRILGQAAAGKADPQDVLSLIGFAAMSYAGLILTLTLFVAVLMVLTRHYKDSEMVVWFSAGQSLTAWIKPIIRFALPFLILISVLTLFGWPWANQQSATFKDRFEQRDDLSKVTAGQFRESNGANRIFFVEGLNEAASRVKNIFVSTIQQQKLGIMVSKEGFVETQPNGDKFLILESGRRYEGQPGNQDYRVMEFHQYGILLEEKKPTNLADLQSRTKSTQELISQPTLLNQAELLWRLSLPFTAFNLVLMAIPMSFVNPRAGRTYSLLFALLAYVVYSNLVNLAQAWVAQGKVPMLEAMLTVHGIAFILAMFLLLRRVYDWQPIATLRDHLKRKQAAC